eukprot:tig00021281_g19933.t1
MRVQPASLHRVCQEDDYVNCAVLIDAKADINEREKDTGRTPLHVAAMCGSLNCAALLIDYGAQIDSRDSSNYTPLHAACMTGHWKAAELLLKHGADANDSRNRNGRTPLHTAAAAGSMECVKKLIDFGARLDAKDEGGYTPLHSAVFAGQDRVVAMLLDYGAQVDAKDIFGDTPLHLAARSGEVECARLLIQKINEPGGDPKRMDAVNNYGRTPRQLAKDKAHREIVDLLARSGAAEGDASVAGSVAGSQRALDLNAPERGGYSRSGAATPGLAPAGGDGYGQPQRPASAWDRAGYERAYGETERSLDQGAAPQGGGFRPASPLRGSRGLPGARRAQSPYYATGAGGMRPAGAGAAGAPRRRSRACSRTTAPSGRGGPGAGRARRRRRRPRAGALAGLPHGGGVAAARDDRCRPGAARPLLPRRHCLRRRRARPQRRPGARPGYGSGYATPAAPFGEGPAGPAAPPAGGLHNSLGAHHASTRSMGGDPGPGGGGGPSESFAAARQRAASAFDPNSRFDFAGGTSGEARARVAQLQEELRARDAEIARLRADVDSLLRDRAATEPLRKRCAELEGENAHLREENKRILEEASHDRELARRLDGAIASIRQQCQDEVNAAAGRARALEQELERLRGAGPGFGAGPPAPAPRDGPAVGPGAMMDGAQGPLPPQQDRLQFFGPRGVPGPQPHPSQAPQQPQQPQPQPQTPQREGSSLPNPFAGLFGGSDKKEKGEGGFRLGGLEKLFSFGKSDEDEEQERRRRAAARSDRPAPLGGPAGAGGAGGMGGMGGGAEAYFANSRSQDSAYAGDYGNGSEARPPPFAALRRGPEEPRSIAPGTTINRDPRTGLLLPKPLESYAFGKQGGPGPGPGAPGPMHVM